MQMSLLRIKDGQPVSVGDIKANVEPVENQVRLQCMSAGLKDFLFQLTCGMPASPSPWMFASVALSSRHPMKQSLPMSMQHLHHNGNQPQLDVAALTSNSLLVDHDLHLNQVPKTYAAC